MDLHSFKWDCGHGEVQSLGAMLGPVHFRLADREIQPFAVMPWGNDTGPEHAELPGILRRTRGEWPCVPFGAPTAPDNLPDQWMPPAPAPVDDEFHGFSANNDWQLMAEIAGGLRLGIQYPQDHPISRLERVVQGVVGQPALKCCLTIKARRDITLPIALHPCFSVSKTAGKTTIHAGFDFGRVLPIEAEAAVSRLRPDAEFNDLAKIPSKTGSMRLDHLPLSFATEEIVQLCGVKGPVRLTNHEEKYQVGVEYDQRLFPSLLLWVSNRGRDEYPWLGRFEGVGIEPICGAFDLGPDVGNWGKNPIASHGVATAFRLRAGQTINTEYVIRVDAL